MAKNWKNHISENRKTYFLIVVLIAVTLVNIEPVVQTVFRTISIAEGSRKKLPIYSVETPEKRVAITFDAAWGADDTDTILSLLSQYDVRATFFLCGYWVDKYPNEVRRIFEAGHEIGNHGNTHAHGTKLSLEQNRNEIMGTHNKVRELLGIEMNLFRAPYGEYNDTVIQAAEESLYFTIQWDVDSLGTKRRTNNFENDTHIIIVNK